MSAMPSTLTRPCLGPLSTPGTWDTAASATLDGVPEPSPTLRRRGRLFRIGAAFVVLLAVAGYLAVQYVTGGSGAPGCKVVSDEAGGTTFEFTPEQAVNAATIAAVGTGRGMPERAVTIALATSLQESGLRNIEHGDRDSIGLFQQRPSQGWGTRKQILDPTYAAGVFYQHLAKVQDYPKLPSRWPRSGCSAAVFRRRTPGTRWTPPCSRPPSPVTRPPR